MMHPKPFTENILDNPYLKFKDHMPRAVIFSQMVDDPSDIQKISHFESTQRKLFKIIEELLVGNTSNNLILKKLCKIKNWKDVAKITKIVQHT